MEEILSKHFKDDPNSRAIVFADFRESVAEIVRILDAFKPAIKAASFIGQATAKNIIGLTQKEQQAIIDNFAKGVYNVLVATCIGEEGLGTTRSIGLRMSGLNRLIGKERKFSI